MTTPETAAVVIPPFIQPDPALWFRMLESTFELASPKPITESKTKYNYVVAHLPPEIATVVRDVIIQPDSSDPYADLTIKIIDRCSESKKQEIRRLLAGESLGDRKPSELLRVMKRRAENHNIDDSLLMELFNQAMPVPVQTILASISPITSDKAAEVADRILAISPNSIPAASSGVTEALHNQGISDVLQRICFVRKFKRCVKKFQTSVDLAVDFGHKATVVVRVRSHVRISSAGITPFFQDKAQKCVPPCSYKVNPMQEE
ncbi:hypothetical protein AVEN_207743-1 [Araneus ventricosus]|uniref:DUF7041 domain-containing protein n=1 Tax=Araneus ventricosus TaxID=182803 RepID=A0A4Y2J6N7_ARAVE|nr:hypothetical protein AVEN_207743-1 [Araneus ventricosus]